MRYAWLALVIVFLSGCLARTYVIKKPRVDREIEGNRGYLSGRAAEFEREHQVKETRTISVLEIETGSHQPPELETKEMTASAGSEAAQTPPVTEEASRPQEPAKETEYTSYTIENGDTLQKISLKFYGTTRKWKMLYEENKDILKSPDKVYPGKTIRIPVLEK
jgi:nucleoid-associated protein YgaU